MKEYAFGMTIPVNTDIAMQNEHERLAEKLKKYLNDGYVVTHITSSVINNNMYVYHWLEKENNK